MEHYLRKRIEEEEKELQKGLRDKLDRIKCHPARRPRRGRFLKWLGTKFLKAGEKAKEGLKRLIKGFKKYHQGKRGKLRKKRRRPPQLLSWLLPQSRKLKRKPKSKSKPKLKSRPRRHR